MAVFFKCKICGEEHSSLTAYANRDAFDAATGPKSLRCAIAGQSATYELRELRWRDAVDKSVDSR